MNRLGMLLLTLVIIACAGGSVLYAHHGTGISYNTDHPPVTLKGTVTEIRWTNPHCSIFLDVKDEKGSVVNWAIEGPSPYVWGQAGFNRNTVKVGQEVTAVVYPSRIANTPNGVIAKIITAEGKEVLRFQRDTPGQPLQ